MGNSVDRSISDYIKENMTRQNQSLFGLDPNDPLNVLRTGDNLQQDNTKRRKCPNCMKIFLNKDLNKANSHYEQCLLSSGSEVNKKSNSPKISRSKPMFNEPISAESSLYCSQRVHSRGQVDSAHPHQQSYQVRPSDLSNRLLASCPEIDEDAESIQNIMQFKRKVQDLRIDFSEGFVQFNISREELLMDSLSQLQVLDTEDLRSEFQVHFVDEQAVDAGGLTKEWLNLVTKEILTCNLKLFRSTNTEDNRFWISQNSDVPIFYEVFGKIIGKAILNNLPINCPLCFTLLKIILGRKNEKEDVKYIDTTLYQAMKFMEDHTIEGIFFETFSVEDNGLIYEFFEGGSKIQVDDLNKEVYINLRVDYELNSAVEGSVEKLKNGINSVIPLEYFKGLTVEELDMLICGSSFINLKEWKKFTVYQGDFRENHQVIRWFWECLEQMTQDDLRYLLTFVTGAGRVPVEGFEHLKTHRGDPARFTLESSVFFLGALPRAHTCFNRLDLPLYRDKDELRKSLDYVIKNHRQGFDFE